MQFRKTDVIPLVLLLKSINKSSDTNIKTFLGPNNYKWRNKEFGQNLSVCVMVVSEKVWIDSSDPLHQQFDIRLFNWENLDI